ncbi:MAG: hypothetical protein U5L45_12185 [Saprospiraceae bacterium]|nr:hypothetical protein [Saprospiraceae bacterium]
MIRFLGFARKTNHLSSLVRAKGARDLVINLSFVVLKHGFATRKT